jgi:hypothetical protein
MIELGYPIRQQQPRETDETDRPKQATVPDKIFFCLCFFLKKGYWLSMCQGSNEGEEKSGGWKTYVSVYFRTNTEIIYVT